MKVVYSSRYLQHAAPDYHPESPDRLRAIMSMAEKKGIELDVVSPARFQGDMDVAAGVHDRAYLEELSSAPSGWLDPDTYLGEETFDIAMLAADGAVQAADIAWEGERVFALLRPPGHHAGRDYYGGFCYINNVAVAAQHLIDKAASRVAIVDIDVHHGNGTWDIFRRRSDVLYISTHQWGIYPGTGSVDTVGDDDGEGYTVSIPFLKGTGDSSYIEAAEKLIIPILTEYKPDAILVSMGGDAHYMDPLASLTLSTPGYLSLARKLEAAANSLCGGRIAYFLEGGYHLGALAETVLSIITDGGIDTVYNDVKDVNVIGRNVIGDVVDVQREFWSLY